MHEEAAVLRFFRSYAADQQRGVKRSVEEYVAAAPQYGDRIRNEWARLLERHDDVVRPSIGGRYVVLESLGRGGFGEVYLAQDSVLDRRVAVKVLDEFRALSPEWRRRLAREAEAVHRIDSDGCCAVHDVGFEGDVPFLVMPWIPGRSLERIFATELAVGQTPVRVKSGLDPSAALPALLALIAKVARTLSAAHRSGVIHRDIKPANVLVRPDGRPIVIDFGLAWLESTEPRSTRSGVFGTPAYAAPEILAGGLSQPDARSDIWSLGAVLFEGLTGERPFPSRGRDGGDTETRVGRPLLRLDTRYGRDVQAVVEAALAHRPAERYPDMDAFAADLERLEQRRPVSVRPAGRVRRAFDFVRHRPTLFGLYAFVVALLVAAVTAATNAHNQAVVDRSVGALARTVEKMADDLRLRGELGMSLQNRLEDAEATLRIASDLRDRIGSYEAIDRSLATILVNAAEIEILNDQPERAGPRLDEALDMLSGVEPTRDVMSCRSKALVLKGDIMTRQQRIEDALVQFRLALEIDEALLRRYPQDARIVSDCGFGYVRIGTWEYMLGNLTAARSQLQRALSTLRRAEQLAPDEPSRRAHVADALLALGRLMWRDEASRAAASAMFVEALDRQLAWVEVRPDDAHGWRVLSITIHSMCARGVDDARLDQVAARCVRELQRRESATSLHLDTAARLQIARLRAAVRAGDAQQVRDLRSEVEELVVGAHAAGRGSPYFHYCAVVCCLELVDVLDEMGDAQRAAKYTAIALQAAREHYQESPRAAQDMVSYFDALSRLGSAGAREAMEQFLVEYRARSGGPIEAIEVGLKQPPLDGR